MKLEEEIVKLELDQAINTFKTQITLGVNILTILVIADVTLTGYAIREKSMGIMLIGIIFPIALIIISKIIKRLITPVIFTGYQLEKQFGPDHPLLITTFVRFLSKPSAIALDEILEKDIEEQTKLLQDFHREFSLTKGKHFASIMYVVTFGQLLVPILLYYFFNWNMF